MYVVKFKGDGPENGVYTISSIPSLDEANRIKLDLLGLRYTAWIEKEYKNE